MEWEAFIDEREEESDCEDDDNVFPINTVDCEIKQIHKELRVLSVGDSFADFDDEASDDELEECTQEEESSTNFVINLGNKNEVTNSDL